MDLLRSQNMARVQGQQQQQLNQQQPFGGSSQQHQPGQPFHDPSSNQPPQSQHPAFMNNAAGNAPSLSSRNPSVLQGFPNAGPDMNRQLLILAQQNQQNNGGGPMNFVRQQQMQAMNQGSSPDTHNLFPSQGMDRRPSPAHPLPLPNNMQPGPTNPMGGQGQSPMSQPPGQGQQQLQRRMTMAELTERANQLRASIIQQEGALQHMSNQHRQSTQSGNTPDPSFVAKIRHAMIEVKGKKEYLQRIMHAIQNNMYVLEHLVWILR